MGGAGSSHGAGGGGPGPGVHREKINTEPLLNDTRYIMVLSVIVLLLTMVIWWCFSRRRASRNSVLLTGLSDSGKTRLFACLVYSECMQTFTSMKENVRTYVSANNSVRIVDVPGAERLRGRILDQYKSSARAIVYVIDSVAVQKEIRDVAEFLYTIISDSAVQKNSTPLLILCNKQDQPFAKGSQVIQTLLEKELNVVRMTKSSQLQSVDPSQSNTELFIGKQGKDFEFSHLSNKVDFAECAALNESEDDNAIGIEHLEKWISKL